MKNKTSSNKLVIVASTLGRDGTSRFLTYLANYLTKESAIQVKMLFFRTIPEESVRLLDSGVDVECLNIKGKLINSFYKCVVRLLKLRPNYCLVGFHQLLWISFLKPLFCLYGIKIVLRDTIIPTLFHKNGIFWKRYLNKRAYKLYDYIIAQSEDMRNDLIQNWGSNSSKLILINNPVDIDAINNSVGLCPEELKNKECFTFVAAGRLSEQKGYDLIIERMSELKPCPSFKLLVLGSGELEEELKLLAKNKGVDNYIKFIGFRTNISSYLYYSDALLLSSRYEGFPNIVLEANALGKPVFSNNCLGGINEIIINGVNGISCDFNNSIIFKSEMDHFQKIIFNEGIIKDITKKRYGIRIILCKYISFLNK